MNMRKKAFTRIFSLLFCVSLVVTSLDSIVYADSGESVQNQTEQGQVSEGEGGAQSEESEGGQQSQQEEQESEKQEEGQNTETDGGSNDISNAGNGFGLNLTEGDTEDVAATPATIENDDDTNENENTQVEITQVVSPEVREQFQYAYAHENDVFAGSELPTTVDVWFSDGNMIQAQISWSCYYEENYHQYDSASEAVNTFQWTISDSRLDGIPCKDGVKTSDTVSVKNKYYTTEVTGVYEPAHRSQFTAYYTSADEILSQPKIESNQSVILDASLKYPGFGAYVRFQMTYGANSWSSEPVNVNWNVVGNYDPTAGAANTFEWSIDGDSIKYGGEGSEEPTTVAVPEKYRSGKVTILNKNESVATITSIAKPMYPSAATSQSTFTNLYLGDTVTSSSNTELGRTTDITLDNGQTVTVPVTWIVGGCGYVAISGYINQFFWYIPAKYLEDYAIGSGVSPNGTVNIRNAVGTGECDHRTITKVNEPEIEEFQNTYTEQDFVGMNPLSCSELPETTTVECACGEKIYVSVEWEFFGSYNETSGAYNSFRWDIDTTLDKNRVVDVESLEGKQVILPDEWTNTEHYKTIRNAKQTITKVTTPDYPEKFTNKYSSLDDIIDESEAEENLNRSNYPNWLYQFENSNDEWYGDSELPHTTTITVNGEEKPIRIIWTLKGDTYKTDYEEENEFTWTIAPDDLSYYISTGVTTSGTVTIKNRNKKVIGIARVPKYPSQFSALYSADEIATVLEKNTDHAGAVGDSMVMFGDNPTYRVEDGVGHDPRGAKWEVVGTYNPAPGATNTFQWTFPESFTASEGGGPTYTIIVPEEYRSGTVQIKNACEVTKLYVPEASEYASSKVPEVFSNSYEYYDIIKMNSNESGVKAYGNSELPSLVRFEANDNGTVEDWNYCRITWEVVGDYDATPNAENTFRWTVVNDSRTEGFDFSKNNIQTTGEVTIRNKKASVTSVTAPTYPSDEFFDNAYTPSTVTASCNTELGRTAVVTLDNGQTVTVPVTWSLDSGDGGYNEPWVLTWTVDASSLADYDVDYENIAYYDAQNENNKFRTMLKTAITDTVGLCNCNCMSVPRFSGVDESSLPDTFKNTYTVQNVLDSEELPKTMAGDCGASRNLYVSVTWSLTDDSYDETAGAPNRFTWEISQQDVEYLRNTVSYSSHYVTSKTKTIKNASIKVSDVTVPDIRDKFTKTYKDITEVTGDANTDLPHDTTIKANGKDVKVGIIWTVKGGNYKNGAGETNEFIWTLDPNDLTCYDTTGVTTTGTKSIQNKAADASSGNTGSNSGSGSGGTIGDTSGSITGDITGGTTGGTADGTTDGTDAGNKKNDSNDKKGNTTGNKNDKNKDNTSHDGITDGNTSGGNNSGTSGGTTGGNNGGTSGSAGSNNGGASGSTNGSAGTGTGSAAIVDATSIPTETKTQITNVVEKVLKLDSRIQTGGYIQSSSEDISFEIPKDIQKDGRSYYLVTADEDGNAKILQNESTEDNMFSATGEADTTYQIIYEEGVPLASMISEEGTLKDDGDTANCYWHWGILAVTLAGVALALFLGKKSKKHFMIVALVTTAIGAALVVGGSCILDKIFLPCEIALMLLTYAVLLRKNAKA